MQNRATGVALWIAAGVLAVAALGMWLWASSQVDERQTSENADAAFGHRPAEDIEPNRGPSIALGAVSAVLFLGGAVFLANQPHESDASDRQSERSGPR